MQKAEELSQQEDWWQPDQYANLNNPAAHYLTTGPEIWKQTEGKITHFVATTGTCGTLTGCSRYFKKRAEEENREPVKIVAVTPIVGHDIPGVRSRQQLALTHHFHEDEYDVVVDCDNREAYEATALINQKESLQGGPTSGLGLAGAVKGVPDEEGNVVVLIFCDSVFKYTDNVRKHLPDLFPPTKVGTKESRLYDRMVQQSKDPNNPDVLTHITLKQYVDSNKGKFVVVDVRPKDEFDDYCHVPGAIHIPLEDLEEAFEDNDRSVLSKLPEDKNTTILSMCNRGIASAAAHQTFKGLGYPSKNVWKGMFAWVKSELPVTGKSNVGPAKDAFENEVVDGVNLDRIITDKPASDLNLFAKPQGAGQY